MQALRPDEIRARGESQRLRTSTLSGYRGSILDRTGSVLAISTAGFEVVADPTMIENPLGTALLLAPALGLDPALIAADLEGESENDRFAMVAPSVDDSTVEALKAIFDTSRGSSSQLNLSGDSDVDLLEGIFVRRHEERVYPNGVLARPVIGLVEPDGTGIFGIEDQLNLTMQGRAGAETIERGVFGSISGGLREVDPAVQGNDVVLTIDRRIQYIVEGALIENCQETKAMKAQAVVSDPTTSEILAMATVVRREDGTCSVPKYNAPVVDTFEPGSVLKVVTAAAAVEELGLTGDSTIEVPKSIEVGDVRFFEHAYDHVAAPYPVSQIISQSMNVGTIRLASQLGKEMLYEYLKAFGFGEPTGLGLKLEGVGRVRPTEDWYGSDLGSIPIGQGISINAVQLNAAYNVIANGGIYVSPSLVRYTVEPDGTEINPARQESRRVVSDATAAEVTDMLVGVVAHPTGTGHAAAVPGYTVAGKTGTAWKVFRSDPDAPLTYGSEGNRRYVVSFAGFLPAENPQLSITVVVDEPLTETTAGLVAAPVFADIAQYSLRILGIPPGTLAPVPNLGGELVRGTPALVDQEAAAVALEDGQ